MHSPRPRGRRRVLCVDVIRLYLLPRCLLLCLPRCNLVTHLLFDQKLNNGSHSQVLFSVIGSKLAIGSALKKFLRGHMFRPTALRARSLVSCVWLFLSQEHPFSTMEFMRLGSGNDARIFSREKMIHLLTPDSPRSFGARIRMTSSRLICTYPLSHWRRAESRAWIWPTAGNGPGDI